MSESSWSDVNGNNIEDFGILDAYCENINGNKSENSSKVPNSQNSRLYTSINPSVHQSYQMNSQSQNVINISRTPYPNVPQPSVPHSAIIIDPLSDITQSLMESMSNSIEISKEIQNQENNIITNEEEVIKENNTIADDDEYDDEVVIIKESDTVNSKVLENEKKMNVDKFRNIMSSEMLEDAIMSVWTPDSADIYRRGKIGNLDVEQLLFIVSDIRNKLLAALSVNETNQLFKCGASDLLCWIHENGRIIKFFKRSGLNIREFCGHILDMSLEDNVKIIPGSLRVIRNFSENNKFAQMFYGLASFPKIFDYMYPLKNTEIFMYLCDIMSNLKKVEFANTRKLANMNQSFKENLLKVVTESTDNVILTKAIELMIHYAKNDAKLHDYFFKDNAIAFLKKALLSSDETLFQNTLTLIHDILVLESKVALEFCKLFMVHKKDESNENSFIEILFDRLNQGNSDNELTILKILNFISEKFPEEFCPYININELTKVVNILENGNHDSKEMISNILCAFWKANYISDVITSKELKFIENIVNLLQQHSESMKSNALVFLHYICKNDGDGSQLVGVRISKADGVYKLTEIISAMQIVNESEFKICKELLVMLAKCAPDDTSFSYLLNLINLYMKSENDLNMNMRGFQLLSVASMLAENGKIANLMNNDISEAISNSLMFIRKIESLVKDDYDAFIILLEYYVKTITDAFDKISISVLIDVLNSYLSFRKLENIETIDRILCLLLESFYINTNLSNEEIILHGKKLSDEGIQALNDNLILNYPILNYVLYMFLKLIELENDINNINLSSLYESFFKLLDVENSVLNDVSIVLILKILSSVKEKRDLIKTHILTPVMRIETIWNLTDTELFSKQEPDIQLGVFHLLKYHHKLDKNRIIENNNDISILLENQRLNKDKTIHLENECDNYKKEIMDKDSTILGLEQELERNLENLKGYNELLKQKQKLEDEKVAIKNELDSNHSVNVALNQILESQYEQISTLEFQIKEFSRRAI